MANYTLTQTGAQIQQILNKVQSPDSSPTSASSNLVSSGGVYAAIQALKNAGFFYVGVATTSTNPGTPTEKVAYIATTPGTYTNFGGLVVNDGEVAVLKYNGSWSKEVTGAATAAQVNQLREKVDEINIVDGEALYITDANGYIIAKVDSSGVHSVNIDETPNIIDGSELVITDPNNYIIARINRNGVQSAQTKEAIACMVLADNYYPTATPTRDGYGNVTHADVNFGTGVAGSLDVTYSNGLAAIVVINYGPYEYTMTIARDNAGNVQQVNIS